MSNLPEWDLSAFYKGIDDPQIKKDFEVLDKQVAAFEKKFRPYINASITDAMAFKVIQLAEAIVEQAVKPVLYAHAEYSVHATDPKYGALMHFADSKFTAIQNRLLFLDVGLSRLPLAKLQQLANAKRLQNYKHFLEKIIATKPHKLSEKEERILNDKDLTSNMALNRLFEMEMSHQTFELAVNGKTQTLNQSQILDLVSSGKRSVRKKAAQAFTKGLKSNMRILQFIFNMLATDKETNDRHRKFKNPSDSQNLNNEITQEMVDLMSQTVQKNYPLVSKFYKLKGRVLGLDQLFDYDRYAPLKEQKDRIGFNKAQQIVINSFTKFSPKFAKEAKKFFDHNWIHAKQVKGKRSGAYCMYGTSKIPSLVFVNYQGKFEDVSTLAHELGHGVHSQLMNQQTTFNYDTPVVLAETASVFAEMLVYEDLKQEIEDKQAKLAFIMSKIERIFATVARQTSMYLFEKDFHDARKQKGELSVREVNQIWLARQKDVYKNSVILTEDYGYWWSYIPHFLHTPFYVYSYAFGQLLVLALYQKYKHSGKKFVKQYLEFLSAGQTKSVTELVSMFDIDLNDKNFWQGGFDVIEQIINEARALHRQIEKGR